MGRGPWTTGGTWVIGGAGECGMGKGGGSRGGTEDLGDRSKSDEHVYFA